MKRSAKVNIVLGLLMVASSGIAMLLTPTRLLASSRPALLLERVVPASFGDWREEKTARTALVNPELETALKQIYTQTLSRTYVNGAGYRIMLSLAYGANQSDALQLHYPETCYPAQGFAVTASRRTALATPLGRIPVKFLETNLAGQRFEPVTYWATVGDVVVAGGIDKKLTEMRYRLGGQIPDGLLFRVSSIDTDAARSFRQQSEFVNALVAALPPADRHRLTGLAD